MSYIIGRLEGFCLVDSSGNQGDRARKIPFYARMPQRVKMAKHSESRTYDLREIKQFHFSGGIVITFYRYLTGWEFLKDVISTCSKHVLVVWDLRITWV